MKQSVGLHPEGSGEDSIHGHRRETSRQTDGRTERKCTQGKTNEKIKRRSKNLLLFYPFLVGKVKKKERKKTENWLDFVLFPINLWSTPRPQGKQNKTSCFFLNLLRCPSTNYFVCVCHPRF